MTSAAAMELARPWVLWGLVLAVPIVLLHLHRRRRVVVPFLPLLKEGIGRAHPLGGWRRLRDLAALLARLGALAAVVLALGGLRPAQAGPPPEDLFVVVDADLTTSVREADGRTRLEHVRSVAQGHIRSARWGRVAVVAARETPVALAGPTSRAAAVRALEGEGLRAAETGTNLDAAVRLALRSAAGSGRARIAVVSAREVAMPELPANVAFDVLGAGATDEDQGFVDFAVVRKGDEGTWRVTASARNFAGRPATRTLTAQVGEIAPPQLEELKLAPGETREVAFDVSVEANAPLSLRLDGDDAFAANDTLHAWLAAPVRPSVLVVHGGAMRPYTRAVLDALGSRIDVAKSGTVAAADLAKAQPRDVTLVDGVALPAGSLKPGAWVFLAPVGGETPFAVGEPVKEPLVWRTSQEDPLVRGLDLQTAYLARGFPVEGAGATGLAFAEGKALVARGEKDGVRYVAIGLDPEGSDLPIRAALPLLLRNAVLSLATAPKEPLEPWYRVGKPLRPRFDLPFGPLAHVIAEGDPVVSGPARGVRIAPTGDTWIVDHASRGATVSAVEWHEPLVPAFTTSFNDLDPTRTIVPVRAEAPIPPAVGDLEDPEAAWRRWLVLAALGFLVVDLLLVRRAVARRAAPEAARAAA